MLRIGWAKGDLTPEKPAYLVGQLHTRLSTHVRDPLTATALAIDSGKVGCQAIIISCDMIAIPEELMERVSKKLKTQIPDFDTDKLIICATHTHNAPFLSYRHIDHLFLGAAKFTYDSPEAMDPECYFQKVVATLSNMAADAWNQRKNGGVSTEFGYAVVGHNRRIVYKDKSAYLYGNSNHEDFDRVEGPSDHGVELLYVWDDRNELSGVVVNVACPAQVLENESFITSDYWSELRKQVQVQFNKSLFILPLVGAAGDISPHGDLIRHGTEPDMRSPEGMVEIGRRISELIWRQYPPAKMKISNCPVFMHKKMIVKIEKRVEQPIDLERAIQEFSPLGLDKGFPQRVMEMEKKRYEETLKHPYFQTHIHCIRLDDAAFASSPFELYTDYGFRIKARSLAKQTFVIQMACGLGGYLPTKAAVEGRGYSALVLDGMVGPEGGDLLVEKTLEMIEEFWQS